MLLRPTIGVYSRLLKRSCSRNGGLPGFMRDKPEDYTEDELTFYWSEEDYREFLEELKEYQQ